jgi:hypothetical protein
MTEQLDTSTGWCCDGRTHAEHENEDGHCCQPENTALEDLPEDAQEKARERMEASST